MRGCPQWKTKYKDNDRRAAADCLFASLEEGNGTHYCEPHTGVYCSTGLTLADVKEVETRCAELEQENRLLQVQCNILDVDVERCWVAVGCAEARSELEMKTKECSELSELNNTIKHYTLDELSLDGDNARVKYYTGLPHFSALMVLFRLGMSMSQWRKLLYPIFSSFCWFWWSCVVTLEIKILHIGLMSVKPQSLDILPNGSTSCTSGSNL